MNHMRETANVVKDEGRADHGDDLLTMLKALGDARRLEILDMLMEGVHCSCEISARLDMSGSLLSHHVRTLRVAGLVRGERDAQDGRWIYYSIDEGALERLNERLGRLLDIGRIKPRVPNCGPQGRGCS